MDLNTHCEYIGEAVHVCKDMTCFADIFTGEQKDCKPTFSQFDPFFEHTVQEELNDLLLTWLRQVPASNIGRRVPVEPVALVMSWAIFGAAVQWSHGERTIPAEQMADYVLTVVTEGVL